MRLDPYREFSMAKSGNRAVENEDAQRATIPPGESSLKPRAGLPTPVRPARFAVADGATEAAFSREWAELLVNRFVDDEPLDLTNMSRELLDHWLKPCRAEWDRRVQSRNIPWFGLAKVRAGSMATFLGVEFREEPVSRALRWRAVAVGDSCLFIVKNGSLQTAFPIQDPGDFGDMPALVGSNPAHAVAEEHIRRLEGICQRGDRVVLATDAVACWALTQHRDGNNPWRQFEEMYGASDEYRERWVAERRADGSMRNDDVTLLATRVA